MLTDMTWLSFSEIISRRSCWEDTCDVAAGTSVLMPGGGLHLDWAELPAFKKPGSEGTRLLFRKPLFEKAPSWRERGHILWGLQILILQESGFFVSLFFISHFLMGKCVYWSHFSMGNQVDWLINLTNVDWRHVSQEADICVKAYCSSIAV